ncbi:hypothetical protein CW674_01020 [Macrococcoides caseolyticum]|uniref:hypothetical protein n=1 Tax=Macrococcoides caseolyticum TaxID=69966 RepID=UPI000C334DD8|nr:hypothetical protein [Macrococcus caseolyticus]PKE66665.1 hypothetical protein CW674_01020 [Macrococcus caseolyticus]
MRKLQALKIALLIVILAEEIKRVRNNTILSEKYSEMKILDKDGQTLIHFTESDMPIDFIDENLAVSLKPN